MARGTRGPAAAEVGMIGLGVMGRNLALNLVDHGFRVAVHERETPVLRAFLDSPEGASPRVSGAETLERLVAAVARPRKLWMMIKAGAPVDAVTERLLPLVAAGDVIVDGGNSLWTDTVRRERACAERGVHFVGCGVSGGEEGARFGPSLMAGGSKEAWKALRRMMRAVAAKVDPDSGKPLEGAAPGKPVRGGVPCAMRVGTGGAGHFVKMVHNGIEYGDMQLICEAYFLLASLAGLGPAEIGAVFARWNRGDLDSFLVEITADILRQRDPADGRRFLVDAVLDTAGQKGTGKWTSVAALDLGVPAPTIAEAVFARFLSALKDERVAAARRLGGRRFALGDRGAGLGDAVRDALLCSKIAVYAQGFALLEQAGREHELELDLGGIAAIWRGGCIIRARFLQKIADAYGAAERPANLMLAPWFRRRLAAGQARWRRVVALAAEAGAACPAFMSALAYHDGYRSARLPANLLQAQRDFFGAHGFERVDRPRGRAFHVDWADPARPMREV